MSLFSSSSAVAPSLRDPGSRRVTNRVVRFPVATLGRMAAIVVLSAIAVYLAEAPIRNQDDWSDSLLGEHESGVLSVVFDPTGRWLASVLLAVGFTSTLTHYYFDGFIWKLRHQQNRENLQLDTAEGSWWSDSRPRAAAPVLLRQALYFGIPMAVLTCGALSVWSHRNADYVQHMYRAHDLNAQGLAADAAREGRQAFADMRQQLPYMRRLAELQPTSSRQAELALLIYNHARYAHIVLPALDGRDVGVQETDAYRAEVEEAIHVLQLAVDQGGSVAHSGREGMTLEDARRMVESWKRSTRRE